MTITASIPIVTPIDTQWVERAKARQLALTKPPRSLGVLEDIANRVVAIQQTSTPNVTNRRVVTFAADHGVVQEGVSPYPQAVTAQMVNNFLRGGAAVNALARAAGAEVMVVDIGLATDPAQADGLVGRSIRRGSANIARQPAMTRDEAMAALAVGIDMAHHASNDGIQMIGLGEMGIGNSTVASAVTAALTGLPPEAVTGRGTGVDDATLAHKVQVVQHALSVNTPHADDPLDVLSKVGGLDIAGLCGLTLGAAARRRVVVVDGFIATAGAALAVRMQPAVRDYVFAAHRSTEPGHEALLDVIGARPILDLGMRLGEGTGAALAFSIIGAAVAVFRDMETFESAGVADRP